jgi:hypothetical protein
MEAVRAFVRCGFRQVSGRNGTYVGQHRVYTRLYASADAHPPRLLFTLGCLEYKVDLDVTTAHARGLAAGFIALCFALETISFAAALLQTFTVTVAAAVTAVAAFAGVVFPSRVIIAAVLVLLYGHTHRGGAALVIYALRWLFGGTDNAHANCLFLLVLSRDVGALYGLWWAITMGCRRNH